MARGKKSSRPGRLRIVAGIWRGRLLRIADVPGLRPTSDRVRETLFNWLADGVHGAKCLDLCAGTGALGFEALSRGAASVVFVDDSLKAVATLKENAAALQAASANIVHGDARKYLEREPAEPFDLVFLDPPFADDMLGDLCKLLAGRGFLAGGARIYLEMDKQQALPKLPDGWTILKDRTAGNVRYLLAEAAKDTR